MKTEEFTNQTLRKEITWWENTNDVYKRFFQHESIRNFLDMVDKISIVITNQEVIVNFIHGLSLIPIINNTKNITEREKIELQLEKLSQPFIVILRKHLETSYRDYIIDKEVTGEEVIPTDRVNVPITKKAINSFIKKTKTFPITPDDIEKIVLDFIDYKEKIYSKSSISKNINKNEKSDSDKIKHNYPTIDTSKYNATKIYNTFFKGELAVCNQDCFNDWLVNGYVIDEQITLLANGIKSRKTGEKTIPIAQFRKFIDKITGDTENTKDGYYKMIFNIKLNNTNTANTLNSKHSKMLISCEN